MKFYISTLDGQRVNAEICDIGSVYPDDDVIYICEVPCKLSSIVSAEAETIRQQAEQIKALREMCREVLDQQTYSDLEGITSIASVLSLENHSLYSDFQALLKGE